MPDQRMGKALSLAACVETQPSSYALLDYDFLPLNLFLPFEHGINPNWARAREHLVGWVTENRLVPRDRWDAFRGARFDELAARTYPHVSLTTLSLVSDFIAALFTLDDLIDHQASALGSRRNEMESIRSYLEDAIWQRTDSHFAATPYAKAITMIGVALSDITSRLLRRLPIEHLEGFLSGFSDYLRACVDEALLRHGGRQSIVSLEEYAELRIRSAALIPCLEAALISDQIILPTALREHPSFATMWRAANLSVSYTNDIFSYNKDVTHGHKTNLLIVLQDIRGLSAEEAFVSAKAIHDGVVRDYIAAKREMVADVEDMRVWGFVTTLLESWMAGSYAWSLPGKNERYTECTTLASFTPTP